MRPVAPSRTGLWLLLAAVLVVLPTCRNAGPSPAPQPLAPATPVAFSVHVTYCKPVEPVLPIGDVRIQLASATDTLVAVTDSSGTADFGAIPPGSYVLAASRARDMSVSTCIGGGDTNRIVPFLSGGIALSECAAMAADVTQDGMVDADDLHALTRYQIFDLSHSAHTAEWRFEGSPKALDITQDATLEVRGVVLGDADLSWPGRF